MKFGLVLPSYGDSAGRMAILDTAFAAERLGFDSVWATDHLALPEADASTFGNLFEAITTLSYLAGSTRQVKLGISALILPQRNPIEVARQLATLDALSGGRVMVAAGIGWSEGEYRALGADFRNRGKRMDEAVRVLRTLWRGGRVITFKGQYYPFEKIVFSPGPVQSGGPLLWIAGNSPAALQRAAFLADGWHPDSLTPEQIGERLEGVKRFLGGRPFTVCPRLRVAVNAAPETERTIAGSPAEVAARLEAYRKVGVEYVVLHFEGSAQSQRERAMTLLIRETAALRGAP